MSVPRHDPLAALRQPGFALYAAGRLAGATAMTMFNAVILYHVYELTASPFQLAFIGLARFLPSLGLTLVGGALADSANRRLIVLAAQVVPAGASLALLSATASGTVGTPLIYALVLAVAVAAAFENPARQALLPQVVTPEAFPNAIVVTSTVQSLGFVTGPAAGGLLIGLVGLEAAYAAHAALVGVAIIAVLLLRPRPVELAPRVVSLAGIREGIRFVLQRQVLIGAMTLDMFAVIFGGAQALLPIYATDILGVGGLGYGILAASLEAGALAMSVALVFLPPIRQAGRALLSAVALFGLGTIAFGLSRNFYLSVATYAFIGMADQVSVVLRQAAVQLSTPDELRGRVSSVNMLFIGASNQLGAVESGLVAGLTSATFAVVSGGVGTLAVVAIVAARLPGLRNYRIEPRVSEPARSPAPAGHGTLPS
ncbi:MFS transporter [Tepidiforma sp.]|uniref:MFS transporter n=1 Tax=Tepidiforma sp. TaxID=2682230 RepID=UPI002ADD8E01|nr:MFS transporter [Tepidiforma sp.]